MTLVLRYAARSDRGLVRSNNQDSVYAGPRLLAVADGMGGHAAGEVASKIVIAALAPLDDEDPRQDLLLQLENATHAGNDAITDLVANEPELDGMGTTLTAMLFSGKRLGMVHVGDSRAYLLRDDVLTQITHDDSFVQSLVDEGRLTADEAANHPQRSLLLQALTGSDVEPSLTIREARAHDRYLLCSDGLTGPVSDETLKDTLQIPDPEDCADRLIDLALRSGGPDNITVIVADVVDVEYGEDRPIVAGAVSGIDEVQDTPNTAAGRAAAVNPARVGPQQVGPPPEPAGKPRKRLWRRLVALLVLLVLLVIATLVGRALIQSNYYVGVRDDKVAVFRGVSGSILGVNLQGVAEQACLDTSGELRLSDPAAGDGCTALRLTDLRPSARSQVSAGLPDGTLDQARQQINQLVRTELLPLCGEEAAASPVPAAPSGQPSPTPQSTTPAPTTPSPSPLDPGATAGNEPRGTDLPVPSPVAGQDCRGAG
ncbi:PP2C family serine/threonine-protein phosphatase [Rhodococcus sp. X156]|uniref:PP2C family protein-serine/threonine phosphatase n=1 Tax=Rhodococcus sp. X156 TaxID=2499145 RepID=UPI000FD82400|nr:PP2C family serine/threonine-protein phosphatase [Rhodococcus sp. X156]